MKEVQTLPRNEAPVRLYQGPRQEKQYRKAQQQRQLLQRERDVSDKQETRQSLIAVTSPPVTTALLPINQSTVATSSVPNSANKDVQLQPTVAKSNIIVIGVIILAFLLEFVALALNGWFAFTTGRTIEDKLLMASLGFLLEGMVFVLPPLASLLWTRRRYVSSVLTLIFFVPLFAFAIYNSLGFATLNLTDTTTARAERVTPAVADAQRRLDTLSASRKDECHKRGDRCRQLEKDEQSAIQTLREAREKVSLTADPHTQSAAKVVSWVSIGRLNPSEDDFGNFKLLVLAVFSQLGGLILMVAKR